ncbi:Abortive infection protein [Methanoplanus limicola DSM 2279]|uniref:Abortive infection protein n=2 Tax=Methanoplanus limicola TaxID=2315 RepID=H1YXS1_9EURY|nr:Abortive infection protein [Methanoplanus limicola DSM 2279]
MPILPEKLKEDISPGEDNARKKVCLFLFLTLFFSCIGWFLVTSATSTGDNQNLLTFTIFTMWCPGISAFITRYYYQRNFAGFGFCICKPIWLFISAIIPILAGLLMFSSAWIFGIAEFNNTVASVIFSTGFILPFLLAIGFDLSAAAGEEIGWRGLLVPEMAKYMGFTKLALISGAIWTIWHFPLIFFSTYSGAGPLWYSVLVFVPSVMGAGLILAWLRLKSGSVYTAILFHGLWNYFIQQFYPALTVPTEASGMMLGEFGWACAFFYLVLAAVFWHFRGKLPDINKGSTNSGST